MIKVGINGFGRIGRIVLSASLERENVQVVAINDLLEVNYIAYMLKYDSTFGRFNGDVGTYENGLVINGEKVPVTAESDAKNWEKKNGADSAQDN